MYIQAAAIQRDRFASDPLIKNALNIKTSWKMGDIIKLTDQLYSTCKRTSICTASSVNQLLSYLRSKDE